MKRANLFIKIYLGFWLTIVITAGAFFYLERMIITKPMLKEWSITLEKTVQFYAEESAAQYSREGVEGLKKYFQRLDKATGIEAYLFDEKGVEVTGQSASGEIREQVFLTITDTDDSEANYVRTDEAGIASRKIVIPPGRMFVFAASFPHPETAADLSPDKRHGPKAAVPTGIIGTKPPVPDDNFLPHPGMPPHLFPPSFLIRLTVWIIVSAVICYLLARYLTSPIFKLSLAARQLADGQLSVRVGPKLGRRRDELSSLASDFDGMADRIEKLLTLQHTLLRDVSHELRSPLARLNVALELCRQNLSSTEQKHLDRIALETERLNDLIGQILTYNRMNADTVDVQKAMFDLGALIDEVVADANYEIRSNRVVVASSSPFFIEGNYDYLRRAIENVVRNAVYHTPADSPIHVFADQITAEGKSMVKISVVDHGRGVPDDALPFIFKPFFKIASGGQHKTGAGLGLSISEAAIRLHHGEVRARNAEAGGLIVEIFLPLSTPDTKEIERP